MTKLLFVLPCLLLFEILGLTTLRIHYHFEDKVLKEKDEICVLYRPIDGPWYDDFRWDQYLEHHKPTYYDYGIYGSGKYCPAEKFPAIKGLHGMLVN